LEKPQPGYSPGKEQKFVITGRRQILGAQFVNEIQSAGGSAQYIAADHTSENDCRNMVNETVRTFGKVDILFNNAGIVMDGTAEATCEEDWQSALNLNVTAVWCMSRLVLPVMRACGGGVIVNNASDWGVVEAPNAVAYCTCKGAVVQMTRAMALDHAHENIRINAICPGDTFVERWLPQGYYKNSTPITRNQVKEEDAVGMPIGRVAHVDEIARAVLFLASNEAPFMVGAILMADGGNTAIDLKKKEFTKERGRLIL